MTTVGYFCPHCDTRIPTGYSDSTPDVIRFPAFHVKRKANGFLDVDERIVGKSAGAGRCPTCDLWMPFDVLPTRIMSRTIFL